MTSAELPQLPPEFLDQPLTAGVLEDFGTCPRKFLLSFVASDAEKRRLRGGAAALHQALRATLLECYQFGGPSGTSPEFLQERFEHHWEGRWCQDSLEEQQLHRAGQQILADYHAAHVGDPRQFVAGDQRLAAEVGGQAFVAVADLVLAPEPGTVEVARLVSSRSPLSAAELRTDLSAQLLWLLANDHFTRQGATTVRVLYYSLRQLRAREVALDEEQAAYLQKDLRSRVAQLRREVEFAPRKGPYCRWCRSRPRCPLWQR